LSETDIELKYLNQIVVKYRALNSSLWYNRNYKLFNSHFKIIIKHRLYEKNTLRNNLDIFLNASGMSAKDKLKILLFIIFRLRIYSLALYQVTRSNKLYSKVFNWEYKFKLI